MHLFNYVSMINFLFHKFTHTTEPANIPAVFGFPQACVSVAAVVCPSVLFPSAPTHEGKIQTQ